MKRYKVRFHLAKGENFMKWQVFDLENNTKNYYDPDIKSIIMRDCLLGNHAETAKKIFAGDNKTVCAWVACEDVRVVDSAPPIGSMTHYKYNPRKNPHWHTDTLPNADKLKFKTMVTINRRVYG